MCSVRLRRVCLKTSLVSGHTSEYKLLTNYFLQLVDKTFTRPVFAVELYDPAEWDFGPVTFQNIVIVRCKFILSPYARSLHFHFTMRLATLTRK